MRRILAAFLPTRYAVGSGFVIDSFGGRSRQVDLVVFDELYSSKLFKTFSQVLFPVETVFACIEVKTTIDKVRLTEVAAGEPINFRIEALCACGEACRPVNDGPKRDRILGTSDKAPNDLSGCLPY